MSVLIHPESSVGQLAAEITGATRIFRKYKIDFCCGGDKSLASVCDGHFRNQETILAELTELHNKNNQSPDHKLQMPFSELIPWILEHYHTKHRQDLPELIQLARRVESVHPDHPLSPIGLTEHLQKMQLELESHMQKEEQILFPAILDGDFSWLESPIACMETEHVEHGKNLGVLVQTIHDFEVPQDACITWRALIAGVQEFHGDVLNHIHLENHVLFPRVLKSTVTE
jgi:regulator of cell morphogenesis and NO signaling